MNYIINPISNITQLKTSHVKGWSLIWQDQLNAIIDYKCSPEILTGTCVYIEHGVNYSGTMNLFGGAKKEIFDNISLIMKCPKVISLDYDMPDWGKQLKGRVGNKTTYEGITETWCDTVSEWVKSVSSLKQEDLKLKGIIVGDSHTPAFSEATDRVLRENGKTLFGTLKNGLELQLRGITKASKITFCYGSIDIRHHFLRHLDFDLDTLLDEYVKQATEIGKKYECEIECCAPVPVEYEGRKIPKTGFYKGTAFFGTRQERLDLTFKFIEGLHVRNVKVIMPPLDWYDMDPEQYAKEYMENNSSFHIAPPFYRRHNWGITKKGVLQF